MSSSESSEEAKLIFQKVGIKNVYEDRDDSGSEEPVSEWSSLEIPINEANPKVVLAGQGLYSQGSGEICAKYIRPSSSSLIKHPYYKYPAVVDPGIKAALLDPIPPDRRDDDGDEAYRSACEEANTFPVALFYKNLRNTEINVSYYGVNSAGIRAMALALQYNKHVKRLNLTENFLNLDACYHLGQMLISNATLEELILTGCRIEETGLVRLIEHLHENVSLILLGLSRNELLDGGGERLAKKMRCGFNIQRLDLSKNKLDMQSAIALTDTFEYTRNIITHLDLSWNYFFHIPSTVDMLNQLAHSQVLEELNLSWNSLEGDQIAKALSKIILIPSIRQLDFSNNRLRDKCVQKIVEFLPRAKRLRSLDLSFNPVSPAGAHIVLKKMLRARVKIENLLMENICVSKDFLDCLERVKKMKCRQNFFVKYGDIVRNWIIQGSDQRELVLQRAAHLGNIKKHTVDVPLYLLKLSMEYSNPVDIKELHKRMRHDHVFLNDDLILEMSQIFPGPPRLKAVLLDLQAMKEFIHRLWPDKTLNKASAMQIPHGRVIHHIPRGRGKN